MALCACIDVRGWSKPLARQGSFATGRQAVHLGYSKPRGAVDAATIYDHACTKGEMDGGDA